MRSLSAAGLIDNVISRDTNRAIHRRIPQEYDTFFGLFASHRNW